MFTSMKIALTAALVLSAASATLANDIETNPSEAQSAREWAAYLGQTHLGQTHGHKHEDVFVSNTYDSPDWAPVYAGPTMRHEAKAGVREKRTDRYVRVPSSQPSFTTDGLR